MATKRKSSPSSTKLLDEKRRVLLAAVNRLMTTEYATYTECENATSAVMKLLATARREGLLVGGGKAPPSEVKMQIRIGELSQISWMPSETYDRLATLLSERPLWSLARLFEIGLVAVAAAESGDATAMSFTRQAPEPETRIALVDNDVVSRLTLPASPRGHRKSRAPRAKARKRS